MRDMTQVERELDGRIDHALGVAGRVRARLTELRRKAGTPAAPTDEDVERIKAFVLGHARTDEWRPVLDRIDRGELTWRAVAEGLARGGADRDVATAFDTLSAVPPASVEKLVEIGVFPARPPAEEAATEPPVDEDRDDDEEWYDENPLGLPNR
jgi:hypothetical protein